MLRMTEQTEEKTPLTTCEVCGNTYDKMFQIVSPIDGSRPRWFDSFECAIHALAPRCSHCGCRIVGHGLEEDGTMYCCAHCARESGAPELRDRV